MKRSIIGLILGLIFLSCSISSPPDPLTEPLGLKMGMSRDDAKEVMNKKGFEYIEDVYGKDSQVYKGVGAFGSIIYHYVHLRFEDNFSSFDGLYYIDLIDDTPRSTKNQYYTLTHLSSFIMDMYQYDEINIPCTDDLENVTFLTFKNARVDLDLFSSCDESGLSIKILFWSRTWLNIAILQKQQVPMRKGPIA